ncbi:MAG: aldose 1-epimerase [Chitinophagaceae bacterium]|nr:aldose 1-epimerase [Chitinophagaceae bacterium]
MFTIESRQENGFNKIVLIDPVSQTRVEIVPGCGAMLHAFIVHGDGRFINVIDSYKSREEFDEQPESKGFKGLKLSPFPCRLFNGSYRFNNKEYRLAANRPDGSVIHGLLYRQSFRLTGEDVSKTHAAIGLLHEYKGENAGYPFAYNCMVNYSLFNNNMLEVATTIKNTGNTELPVADGWHPYFTFSGRVDELELSFRSAETLEFKNLIPTGRVLPDCRFVQPARIGSQEIDNSFILDFAQPQPMCVLRDPATQWQLAICPEKSYPYLQVYIPPHRQSIAIENLSAPPDAFNNGIGLVTLSPGKSTRFLTRYIISRG